MKTCVVNGYVVKIGQNAQENWNILTRADGDYWFFHLSSFPSGYVIWECVDENLAIETLRELASLCVSNTKHKSAKNIKVDYTQCKNVEKGERIGEVYYNKGKVNVVKI